MSLWERMQGWWHTFRKRSLSERAVEVVATILAMSRRERFFWGLGLLATIAIVFVGSMALHNRAPAAVAEPDDNQSATDAAIGFTRAWVSGNRDAMLRFVDPRDARQFDEWLAKEKVPASLASAKAADRRVEVVQISDDLPNHTLVVLRVGRANQLVIDPKSNPIAIEREAWMESGGQWHFDPNPPPPKPKARSAASSPVVAGKSPQSRPAASRRRRMPDDDD